MMTIISLILAYFMVGCTVSIVLGILSGDYDFSLYTGLIWPLGVPIVIVALIIYAISMLLCKIIGFIRKSIEKRSDKEKKQYD